MKKIIIITGNELRHDFFKKFLASSNELQVIKTYCEVPEDSLLQKIQNESNNDLRSKHLKIRKQSEKDFFELFCSKIDDNSNSCYIPKGTINSNDMVNEISNFNPDIILSFGCSIIKSSLLETYKGRFVNIHLGLSPYYRGSGTNLFPFTNEEISCVGVTFMHIDAGIDTGAIIHQIRPTIAIGDSVHQIGNRLILEMTIVCEKLIVNFNNLKPMQPIKFDKSKEKIFKNADFSEAAVELLYDKFNNRLIENYLRNKTDLDSKYPIIHNQIFD